jgi:type VI secretion system secreted protein Hcp
MTTNRRDVLRGATGLAAATAIGGALAGGSVQAAPGQGGSISGEIENLGQFQVLAFSWGASNSGTVGGGSGGGGTGRANIQDVSLTKFVDELSPGIFLGVASGTHFPQATVRFVAKEGSPVITIEMNEVLLTSLSTGGSANEAALTENVTINFAEVTFSVNDETATWNVVENRGA